MTSQMHEQLLALQDIDLLLMQLRHKRENHPIQLKINETELAAAADQEVADEILTRRSDLQDQQDTLEKEVLVIESRRSEIEAKLYDGSVTGTKDLLTLQEEAKMLKERQESIEDDELAFMEQIEAVEAELAPVDEKIQGLVATKAEQEVLLENSLAEIAADISERESERVGLAPGLPADLIVKYEVLRDDLGGIAVARLAGDTCGGCHMALSAVALDRLKNGAEDELASCDDCGRILVF